MVLLRKEDYLLVIEPGTKVYFEKERVQHGNDNNIFIDFTQKPIILDLPILRSITSVRQLDPY